MNIFQIQNNVNMLPNLPGNTWVEKLTGVWVMAKQFTQWTNGELRQVFGMAILEHGFWDEVDAELVEWNKLKNSEEYKEIDPATRASAEEFYGFLEKLMPMVHHLRPLHEQKKKNENSTTKPV